MIVLDSYAVLALLLDEPAAGPVQRLLERNSSASLTAVGVAEVVDRLIRLAGVDPDEAALDLAQLGLVDAVPLDGGTALRAGRLRAQHYHRRSRAVSLADCIAAEVARSSDSALATSDPHLLDLCDEEAIRVVVLPNSQGDRWTPDR